MHAPLKFLYKAAEIIYNKRVYWGSIAIFITRREIFHRALYF